MHDPTRLQERLKLLREELEKSTKLLAQIEEAKRLGAELSFDTLYLLGKLVGKLPGLRKEIAELESKLWWGGP
mgnify:CR=1 FL=1